MARVGCRKSSWLQLGLLLQKQQEGGQLFGRQPTLLVTSGNNLGSESHILSVVHCAACLWGAMERCCRTWCADAPPSCAC